MILFMGHYGVHSFPKAISSKVNVIARLDFEIANYDVTVQYIIYHGTKSSPYIDLLAWWSLSDIDEPELLFSFVNEI